MQTEYEVKILDINVEEIKKKLEELGAKKVAERNMRRYVYDLIVDSENNCSKWARLRDNGEKITLTVKDISQKGIDGTKESEIIVEDFSKAHDLMCAMGFESKAYQENKRSSYKLGDTEFEIDSWPKIPTYLEIEGKSVEEVKKTIELLGFKIENTTSIGVTEVYKKYGFNLYDFKELKF